MIRFKATTLIIHLTSWLLFLTLPLIFMTGLSEDNWVWESLTSLYYWQFCLCYVLLFYLNLEWWFPKLFLRKKYGQYATVVTLFLVGVNFLQPFDHLLREGSGQLAHAGTEGPALRGIIPLPPVLLPTPPSNHKQPAGSQDSASSIPGAALSQERPGPLVDVTSIFICLIVMALSTAARTLQQWRETEKRAIQAEADKANTELLFLKAQINPHFLFNTLNNIYSLAFRRHEKTADSVMKLSKIMRYVTSEVTTDFVPLAKEVEYIRDYLDLQRLRLTTTTQIDLLVSGDLENKVIAPLLLMTFIENTFKHGVSNHEPAPITIKLAAEEHAITFFCQNRLFAIPRQSERTCIGLANNQRRLAHLYPDKHTLSITQDNHLFTVQLSLQS